MGTLFYVYFYYWTTMGLAIALLIVTSRPRRKAFLLVGLLGLTLGMPALLSGWKVGTQVHADWKTRNAMFLPIGHFDDLLVPKLAFCILLLALLWLRISRDAGRLAPIVAVLASGLALTNHQIITGLQIENFHFNYAWGPCATLLAYLMIVDLLKRWAQSRWHLPALMCAAVLMVLAALWLRYVEGTQTYESATLTNSYHSYYNMRGRSSPLHANSVIAGEERLCCWATIMENQRPLSGYPAIISPTIGNSELHLRRALNEILLGRSRDE